MRQRGFDFAEPPPMPAHCPTAKAAAPAPWDPNVDAADVPRLTGQNLLVYERLKLGSATNVELARISLKYTSRISDLRQAGHTIDCERGPDGLNRYNLRENP